MSQTNESPTNCSLTLEICKNIESLTDLAGLRGRFASATKPPDLKAAKREADSLLKNFQKIHRDVEKIPTTGWNAVDFTKVLELCLIFSTDHVILNKVSKVWKIIEDLADLLDVPLPDATSRFAEYFDLHEAGAGSDKEESRKDFSKVNLLCVSNLLEVRCIAPQWLESNTEYLLSNLLEFKLKSASGGDVLDDAFSTVKLLMQTCHIQPEKVRIWTQRDQESGSDSGLKHLFTGLIRMMCGKRYNSETCRMSALALVIFLKTVSEDGSLQENIKTLSQFLLLNSQSSPDNISSILIGGQSISITSMPDLSQSEFAFGTSCFGSAALKGLEGSTLISSKKGNSCLLESLLELIWLLQERKQGSEYQYVLFISTWYETSLQHCNNPDWQQTDALWSRMESVMQVMWCEINTPVAGLQEQLMKAFLAFIKILHKETQKNNSKALQLYQQLTQKVLAAPFHLKARYLILASIIQTFGSSSVISIHPVIPDELVKCMHTNHLRSVAELVYKCCVEDVRDQLKMNGVVQASVLEEWKHLWNHVILTGLCSDDSLARNHVCIYFVSHTLRAVPQCLKLLIEGLSPLPGVDDARKLHATIMILKQAKMKGILTDSSLMEYESKLTSGLLHLDDSIRSDSFSLLVQSNQTCQPYPARSLKLLKEFIFNNLNSDNTAFRNNVVMDVKTAINRMRDSSSPLVRQMLPEGRRSDQDDVSTRLLAMATTADEIFEVCLRNLFPGASYQRKRTCLDILTSLFQCFLKADEGRKQKSRISEETKLKLLRWMQENGKCHFLSARSACLLLSCLLEPTNDVRNSAFNLLVTHFPWPLPHCDTYPWAEPTEILCLGLKLVSSPRCQDCEAGSLLCKLSFMKNVVEKKTHMRNLYPDKTFDEPVRKAKRKDAGEVRNLYPPKHKSPGFHFLQSLLDSLKFQFTAMQKNTLIAAALTPMHGLVMALSLCVVEVPDCLEELAEENKENAKTLVSELVGTVQGIGKFILELLSGRAFKTEEKSDQLAFSPSFGEMTMAITDVVSSLSQLQVEDGVENGTCPSLEHQLILSCSWLSLKHCSHLLSQLSALLIRSGKLQSLMEDGEHVAIATTLWNTLTLCRHKGVIENCSVALSGLCSAFLTSSKPTLEKEVEALLQRTFDLISNKSQQSSITKRSAGLPMLVEAVVAAEPKQRERKLLKFSMVKLMALAKEPLPDELSDTEDLPQAHAINIIRSLFRSSSLAEDIGVYISEVLQFTITGFSSSSFSVRNSCMQLFSILVARLFGQKRVSDEHSILNGLSVEELFSRYGDVREYLLTEVVSAAKDLRANEEEGSLTIRPGLQPVLVILSKLGRGIQDKYDGSICKPFRESLLTLLSSPIYYVRRLIPRALLPFVANTELEEFTDDLLTGFPSSPGHTIRQNKIHGDLLLLQELINQETSADSRRLRRIGIRLPQVSPWVGQGANPCASTRAAFIRVITLIFKKVDDLTGMEEFSKLCQSVIKESDEDGTFRYQVDGPELCDTVTDLAFLVAHKLPASTVTPLEVAVKFLHHPSGDVRLAVFKQIANNLGQFSSPGDLELLATSAIHCLIEETAHNNQSEGLHVLASLFSIAGDSALQWDIPEWWNLHSKLVTMATGNEGSLLCGSSIPVLSSLCRVDSKRCQTGFDWHEWVSLMTQYCQPDQSETLRMAVVKSLHIAAGKCFAALCEREEETDAECAVSLLKCILKLLQDEQSHIRQDTARFVNMLTHNASGSSVQCVQVNLSLKIMVHHFCGLFSWSRSALNLLFEWLSGSPGEAVTAVNEQLKSSQINLFEQISDNIFVEPVIEVEYLAAGIEILAKRLSEADPDYMTKWLESRYQTVAKEIGIITEVLGRLTVADKSFFGVTGITKPYQAVYKQLRSVAILSSVSALIGIMQPFETHKEELTTLYETIIEMHHIHPLLQDDVLLSRGLET